jgi:hypothetical protein
VVSSQAVPPADERRAKVSASLKAIAQRPGESRCAQNPGVQLETPAFFIFHCSFLCFGFRVSVSGFGNKVHHQKVIRLVFQRHQLQDLRLFLKKPFAVLAGLVEGEGVGDHGQGGAVVFVAAVHKRKVKRARTSQGLIASAFW